MREPKGWDEAANGCKILRRRRGIQPPFPLMSKEKAAGGEKETSKGGFASEQTPHPSSCPPQAADRRRPFRCSSFSHTNRFAGFAWEPCPFAIPLKRPRRGLRPPSLEPSPLRISEMAEVFTSESKLYVCRGRCPHRPVRICCFTVMLGEFVIFIGPMWASSPTTLHRTDIVRIPYVKYSAGANKATCTARRALGKPDPTAARRAFLAGSAIGEWHAESKCLFCA